MPILFLALVGLLAALSIRVEPRRLLNGVLLLVAAGGAGLLVLLLGLAEINDETDPLPLAYALLGLIGAGLLSVLALGLASVANGLTMLRREARRPANLLSLLLGIAVLGYCAMIGVFWVADARRAEIAFGLFVWLVTLALPLAYLALGFVAFAGYGLLYRWGVRRWPRPVDVVVVLGAGLRGDRVTPLLAGRLDRARAVLEQSRASGRDTRLICSGGQGPGETVPEAVAMAAYLLERGVPDELLLREDRSRTTEENLLLSARIARDVVGPEALLAVVTNDYHAFRAALLMRRLGLPGYATGSRTARYFVPSATLREYVAVLRDHRWLNGAALLVLSVPAVFATLALLR